MRSACAAQVDVCALAKTKTKAKNPSALPKGGGRRDRERLQPAALDFDATIARALLTSRAALERDSHRRARALHTRPHAPTIACPARAHRALVDLRVGCACACARRAQVVGGRGAASSARRSHPDRRPQRCRRRREDDIDGRLAHLTPTAAVIPSPPDPGGGGSADHGHERGRREKAPGRYYYKAATRTSSTPTKTRGRRLLARRQEERRHVHQPKVLPRFWASLGSPENQKQIV